MRTKLKPKVEVVHQVANDPDKKDDESAATRAGAESEPTLADELGVEDLTDILFAERGRIFSAAGRESPIVEVRNSGLVMRPALKPFDDRSVPETISYGVDEKGIMLNELGEKRKLAGARFKGHALFAMGEKKEGTEKHLVAWFDEEGKAHRLIFQGDLVTTDLLYKIRNSTHDGEVSVYPQVDTE